MRQHSRLRSAAAVAIAVAVIVLGGVTLFKHRAGEAADPVDRVRQGAPVVDDPGTSVEADPAPTRPRRVPAMSPLEVQQAVHRLVAARARAEDAQSRQNARYKASLAATFHGERTNPQWALPAQAELERLATSPEMAAAGITPGRLAVRCRATTCQTSASFASNAQADDWVMLYMAGAGPVLRNSVVSRSIGANGSIDIDILSKATP